MNIRKTNKKREKFLFFIATYVAGRKFISLFLAKLSFGASSMQFLRNKEQGIHFGVICPVFIIMPKYFAAYDSKFGILIGPF